MFKSIFPYLLLFFSTIIVQAQTLTVTKLADTNDGHCDTDCSLREAISQAVNGDIIQFSVTGTITLNGTALVLDKQLTLEASLPVTISGNNSSRVFEINSAGDITLSGLIISDGKTSGEGGGILLEGGELILEYCTVSHNESTKTGAIRGGGGIANLGGTLTVRNSTISGNATKKNGGGILARDISNPTVIINSTITDNRAGSSGISSQGGGVHQKNNGVIQLKNTIVAGNFENGTPDDCGGNITSLDHNLVGSNTGCPQTDQTIAPSDVTSQVLQPLQNGGNGMQVHPLQLNSPAIDQGDNSAVTTLSPPIEFDQRGGPDYPRILDGDNDANAVIDIGAVEAPGTVAVYHSPDIPIEGTLNVGTSKLLSPITKTFSIENLGNADLVLYTSNIDNFTEFSIILSGNFPITITNTQIITIQCNPLGLGLRTATLELTSNDPYRTLVTYQLTCTGANTLPPGYDSSPVPPGGTLDLGSVGVLSQSTRSLVIEETGEADLSISALNLLGSSDFSIISPTALPVTIPEDSGMTQTIVIQCSPSAEATSTGTLEVISNDPDDSPHYYNLTCQGVAAVPGYSSMPTAGSLLDFGTTKVGTSVEKIIEITEVGNADLTVNTPTITGAQASDFSILSPATPFTLPNEGAAVTVTVQCTPKAAGSRTAQLTFTSNDPDDSPHQYTLNCEGIPAVMGYSSVPSPGGILDFGAVVIDQIVDRSLEIIETGNTDLIISAAQLTDTDNFTLLSSMPLNIPDGNNNRALLKVRCQPKTTSMHFSTLKLTTNDPNYPTVSYSLKCFGLSPPTPPSTQPTIPPVSEKVTLTIVLTGEGQGQVSNDPYPTHLLDIDPVPSNIFDEPICRSTRCSYTYEKGTLVTLQPQAMAGSTFAGWGGPVACTNKQLFINSDIQCTAYFEPQFYQLTVTRTGQGTIQPKPAGQPCGDHCWQYAMGSQITLTATAQSGSVFKGWQGDCDQTGQVYLEGDKTCTALFTRLPHLTVTATGSGHIDLNPVGSPCGAHTFCYPQNTAVTLTAMAADNAVFDQWQGDTDCSDGQVQLDQDKQCNALFNPVATPPTSGTTYALTLAIEGEGQVNSQPAGIACGSDCTAQYASNTTVTLTATAAAGAVFTGWQGDCPQGQVVMDNHKQCRAVFSPLPAYNLTVERVGQGQVHSQPAGIECGEHCLTQYPKGMEVTLVPQAATGFIFTGWQQDCDANGHVLMTTHKQCTAIFKQRPTLQFAQAQLAVAESVETVVVVIKRIGLAAGEVSVAYHTQDGTAQANSDYAPQQGILTWADGDSADKVITLNIAADRTVEHDETFSLVLADPSTGVRLGTPQTIEILIHNVPWYSSLQFTSPSYTVNESDSQAIVLVSRAGSKRWPVTVDYHTVDASALAGSDYTAVQGTLSWAEGDRMHKTIEIPITTDGLAEPKERFSIVLSHPTNEAELGAQAQSIVTLIDTPTAGSLEFAAADETVAETAGALTVTVNRIGDSQGAVAVQYATADDTAIANSDYTAVQGLLQWATGDQTPQTFTIPILADAQPEEEETLTLTLSAPTGGANIGALGQMTVKIVDDRVDSPTIGDPVAFALSAETVPESISSVTMAVNRLEQTGALTVDYRTQDVSALAGQDYLPVKGTLQWAEGEFDPKYISIAILDDALVEADEHFSVQLVYNGRVLGETGQATLTLLDDDAAVVQFSESTYVVGENNAEAVVTVIRQGGIGTVRVDYATLDDSAQAGGDYTPMHGTLTWLQGDFNPKTIRIPLHYSAAEEGNEAFQVSLSQADTAVQLGTPAVATVILAEDDFSQCQPAPVIDCFLLNHGNTLGQAYNIRITTRGTVVGGQLAGQIQSAGEIRDVVLLHGTEINGGRLSGYIRGEADVYPWRSANIQTAIALATLNQAITLNAVTITAHDNTQLEHVIVGRESIVESGVALGPGVRFEDNSAIPESADLVPSLGQFAVPVLGQRAVKLSDDVLVQGVSDGILGTINKLHELQAQNLSLTQQATTGYLELDLGETYFAVMPLRVQQILRKQQVDYTPLGMTLMPDGQVIFVTHTGREIIAYPVVHAVAELQTALRALGLNEVVMQTDGCLNIPLSDTAYFSVRPSLFSTNVSATTPMGFYTEAAVVSLVFDDQGIRRQQAFYPASADAKALTESGAVLKENGFISWQHNGRLYEGYLDYLVTSAGNTITTDKVQLLELQDENVDGLLDYLLIYPDGDKQLMFGALSHGA
jgi:CSLREA domain-containing protein